MRIAITGISDDLDLRQTMIVKNVILAPPVRVDEWITGCAFGVDTVAALEAMERYPSSLHRLVIPTGPHNKALVQHSNHHAIHDWMGPGTNYMERNDRMIYLADGLFAFPRTFVEEQRSGTWATIRRARKKDIPIYIYPLDQ